MSAAGPPAAARTAAQARAAADQALAAALPFGWTLARCEVTDRTGPTGVVRLELRDRHGVVTQCSLYPPREGAGPGHALVEYERAGADEELRGADEWLSADELHARAALYLRAAAELDLAVSS